MNYIGSKHKLLPFLDSIITKVVGTDLSQMVFCDIFAGTGAVGRYFKTRVKKVIANDCEYYGYVLNRNYIVNHIRYQGAENLIHELNDVEPIGDGFIYQNYCAGSGSGRMYFSDENGKKIDAIRTKINDLKDSGKINADLYYFLLCSLLESADRVANTASVYGAFLKKLKKSAAQAMVLFPAMYECNENTHAVYQEDANDLIKHISGDILYLDPPYNARQYGANYHLLNTIAEYKPFEPIGKTGLRRYQHSQYCSFRTAKDSLRELLKKADFRYVFLSYNNEGLISADDIREVMLEFGRYTVESKQYQRFKADKDENRNHTANSTIEYLHVLEMA